MRRNESTEEFAAMPNRSGHDNATTLRSTGYAAAPWHFRGRALYQLHAIRVSDAQKHIPNGLPIISFLGWTLGGVYLAKYADSPVGPFNELVVISGLVWHRIPHKWVSGSCAWAARVYVDNREARDHGRQEVGLPSHLVSFDAHAPRKGRGAGRSWWHQPHSSSHQLCAHRHHRHHRHVGVPVCPGPDPDEGLDGPVSLSAKAESAPWWQPWRGTSAPAVPLCSFDRLPPAHLRGWAGPRIGLALPSFSGRTEQQPGLLKYACALDTHVRPVRATAVTAAPPEEGGDAAVATILGGHPLLALAFDNMEMSVQAPQRHALYDPNQHQQQQIPLLQPA